MSNEQKNSESVSDFLNNDRIVSLANKPEKTSMTMLQFVEMVAADPSISKMAHDRIFSMIDGAGYHEVSHTTDPRRAKILGLGPNDIMRVPKFFDGFEGLEGTLNEIMKYYYSAAGGGEESRQVLYFWGPVSSGKSTLAERMRFGLERFGFYRIEGCNNHDNPLSATPRHVREELKEKFGVYVHPRADICLQCRQKLKDEYKGDYRKFDVEWKSFSQRSNCGIAVVSEVDPVNFDISVLIGHEDISTLDEFKRGDPRTLNFDGAFNNGNPGYVEFVEIFKNPPEAHRPIITATQEKYVPGPKLRGQVYVDVSIVAHSNEAEWNEFKNNSKNEAIMSRIKEIRVPYNLRLTEEVQIYKKSFLAKSTQFDRIHIDPHALEQAAMFALLTRLQNSPKCDPMTKLKLYDGQTVLVKGEKVSVSLRELKEQAGLREGMVGIGPRDIIKEIVEESLASYRNRWEGDENHPGDEYLKECGGYLNPIWVRDAMVRYVEKQDIPEDADWPKPSKKRWLAFIQDTLHKEYLKVLESDILEAGVESLEEQAEANFQEYLEHVLAWSNKKKLKDKSTQEELEPDIKLMQSVEQQIGKTGTAAESFRHELASAILDLLRSGHKVTWRSYEPVKEAIEQKFKSAVKEIIKVVVQTNVRGDDVKQKKHDAMVEALKKKGYAAFGVEIILQYAKNHLWRD